MKDIRTLGSRRVPFALSRHREDDKDIFIQI